MAEVADASRVMKQVTYAADAVACSERLLTDVLQYLASGSDGRRRPIEHSLGGLRECQDGTDGWLIS